MRLIIPRHSSKSRDVISGGVSDKPFTFHKNGRQAMRRAFNVCVRRRAVCFALISSLLILPSPGIAASEVRALASTAVDLTTSPIRFLQPFLKSPFGFRAQQKPRRETLADRRARVSQIRVSPLKLVGYLGEGATFTASPTDSLGRTIQGVKFDGSPPILKSSR
jgi:hypothetical protein